MMSFGSSKRRMYLVVPLGLVIFFILKRRKAVPLCVLLPLVAGYAKLLVTQQLGKGFTWIYDYKDSIISFSHQWLLNTSKNI